MRIPFLYGCYVYHVLVWYLDVRTCHQNTVLMLQTVENHHEDAWNEPQVFCKNREHSQLKDYLSRPSSSSFSSSVTMKKNKL